MISRGASLKVSFRCRALPLASGVLLFCLEVCAGGQTNALRLEFTPAGTSIKFTLGDILHTIHGSFQLKHGEAYYSFPTNAVRGELVVDATSGQSGNRSRDRRMHRDILETGKYPEIIFRPDRVEGKLASSGTSTVQVHGVFSLHGSDHEMTVPLRVEIFPDHWNAETQFTIPYVKWGLRNASTFFWRVSESVEIEFHATGKQPFRQANH
jgi:polyisoprenoid-binding protein YceI